MGEHSLTPEWLSFHRELPSSSSQEKSLNRHTTAAARDRFRNGRQFSHSYHHLNYIPSSPSPVSSGQSWRSGEINPRVLNRSKSSPVFDSKDPSEAPKSPDRSSQDRSFLSIRPNVKPKPPPSALSKGGKPPLLASRSQPNLLSSEKMVQFSQNHRLLSKSQPSTTSHLPLPASLPPSSSSSSSSSPSPPTVSFQPPPPATPSVPPSSTTSTNTTSLSNSVPNSTTTSSVQDEMSRELERLKGLVPSVTTLNKGRSRLEIARKGSHSKLLGPKKQPDRNHFRKASSEPLLPLPFAAHRTESHFTENEMKKLDPALVHKIKAFKNEKMRLKETLEDSSEKALLNRNSFFMDVIKKEKSIRDGVGFEVVTTIHEIRETIKEEEVEVIEESEEIDENEEHVGNGVTLEERMLTSTIEDEEKFLRLLGWVPEEEDHVPDLDEEEIAEVKKKLMQKKES